MFGSLLKIFCTFSLRPVICVNTYVVITTLANNIEFPRYLESCLKSRINSKSSCYTVNVNVIYKHVNEI